MQFVRDAFSLPHDLHYLNCAYMSPLSRRVKAVGAQALARQGNPAVIQPAEFFAAPDSVRSAFAKLINADSPRRVALVPSVSYAMALATRNISISAGANIVVIGEEFPSAVLVWRRIAAERGIELRTIPRGERWTDRLYDAINARTVVVVLAHVHWLCGTRFDIEALAARARQVGAAVVIDGTQSIGALPFDTARVQPDMVVCSGYKWLMGGYGLSVAYFGERFDYGAPLEENWTSQVGSDDFPQLAEYRDAYRPDASKYDGGQRATFILTAMLAAAIEQLLDWGVERVQQHCATLVEPFVLALAEYGIVAQDRTNRASHLFGLSFTGSRKLTDATERLAARNVRVSVRGDAIRVSPHLYNDENDLASLYEALTR